jgi:hypothetical protein
MAERVTRLRPFGRLASLARSSRGGLLASKLRCGLSARGWRPNGFEPVRCACRSQCCLRAFRPRSDLVDLRLLPVAAWRRRAFLSAPEWGTSAPLVRWHEVDTVVHLLASMHQSQRPMAASATLATQETRGITERRPRPTGANPTRSGHRPQRTCQRLSDGDHQFGHPERLGVPRSALHPTQAHQPEEELLVPPVA